jgi:ADP-ribose pyrophosphatase YjhB (NUDIX family)
MTEGNIGSFAAILDRYGRVLIVQERKRPHRFGYPGGRVEQDESLAAAVVREREEETGLTPRVVHLVGRYSFTSGLEAHVFLCEVEAGAPLVSEDGLHVAWHAPSAIPQPVRSTLHYSLGDVLTGRREVHRTGLDPIS